MVRYGTLVVTENRLPSSPNAFRNTTIVIVEQPHISIVCCTKSRGCDDWFSVAISHREHGVVALSDRRYLKYRVWDQKAWW